MAGIDDSISIFGDWAASNPSPRTFISKFFNEDTCSRPFPDLGDSTHFGFAESENHKSAMVNNEEVEKPALVHSSDIFLEPVQFNVSKSSSKGALSERMAARAGFNTLTVNTSRNGAENVISSPSNKRCSYVLLSPGVSPTTLLESPVFLSNAMAQPSPTTGKFPFARAKDSNIFSTLISVETDKTNVQPIEDVRADAFTFPRLGSSFPFLSHSENKFALSIEEERSLANMSSSLQPDLKQPAGFTEASETKEIAEDVKADSFLANESSPPDDNQNVETDPKGGEFSSVASSTAEEDGYNWRKYGQKHVKGSEFPRSYYKCTFLNCPVKKKVERSLEGHVTEIVYRGAHNHPKPPSNRRSSTSSSHSFSDTQMDNSDYHVINANFDGKPTLVNAQNGNGGSEWRGDGIEAVSSTSIAEFATSNSMQTIGGSRYDGSEALNLPSAMSNDEEEDDGATHGSFSMGCDAEGEEMDSKRRKLDLCTIDMSAASRAMREPRVVVQTTSEVDILDDGYRWRKYGQKVVKGNPNPRSYYKCTNPGCTVRKHVERASHDLKSVITTYEGKHNHDVPTAKTSNHQSTGLSNSTATGIQPTHSLHRRAEPIQEILMGFENHAPVDPFALPSRDPQFGTAAGFAFGFGHQGLASLGIGSLGPMGPLRMPVFAPVNSYLEHQRKVDDGGFIIPKGEPKEEPILEFDLPSIANAPKGYYQFANRLSLGPYL
ncbi:hypothetical protein IEQ34_011866 [Dendrobium chrysotoxum]|uniref:WRKY domain-containing protein n=1 Tax=Dendrobium chrysotoxum TaxID=161865 RepID=A0AAV7GSC0_DENCH|nr:hypothetical protein IEQ34_011866 [Dendrobium chrysotoxum]